jgi:hypothetical protein
MPSEVSRRGRPWPRPGRTVRIPRPGAAEAARCNLSDGKQQAILRDQIAGYAAYADRYEALGQQDAAGRLRAQARLLTAYLG